MTSKRLTSIIFLLLLFTISLPRIGVDSDISSVVSVVTAIVEGFLFYYFKIRNNISTPIDSKRLKFFYIFLAVSFLMCIGSLLAIG